MQYILIRMTKIKNANLIKCQGGFRATAPQQQRAYMTPGLCFFILFFNKGQRIFGKISNFMVATVKIQDEPVEMCRASKEMLKENLRVPSVAKAGKIKVIK